MKYNIIIIFFFFFDYPRNKEKIFGESPKKTYVSLFLIVAKLITCTPAEISFFLQLCIDFSFT